VTVRIPLGLITAVTGVSGSGKTCVLIHRAIRLAHKYPDEPILVLTLNAALAALIESLVDVSRGEMRPRARAFL
jgi:excinuclease UvrABC ATPase subunit